MEGTLLELQFDATPTRIYTVHDEYASSPPGRTPHSNFLRGVKWSPDGACLLTASDDNCLRVYDTPLEAFHQAGYGGEDAAGSAAAADGMDAANGTPAAVAHQPAGQRTPAQPPGAQQQQQQQGDSLSPALRLQCGELLYDYCWFSGMTAADPASCCLATTGRAQPVHLWDALSGELRCTYRAYNDLDEVAPAHSLAFSLDGATLYCGFNKQIRSFRIVSCMALNPDREGMLAAGSYSGAGLLLDTRTRGLLCLLEGGHSGGLTHLCFSADGNFLYTGARKDPAILCWDVRYSSGVVYSMQRASAGTNQRMYFDIEPCGRHLATGGEDGVVRVFDLRDGSVAGQFVAAEDTVNGVHFHPFLPLLATASGHRRYFLAPDDASSASDSDSEASPSSSSSESDDSARDRRRLSTQENVLNIWHCSAIPAHVQAAADEEMEDAAGEAAAGEAAAAALGA
ncbi:hypothetical protein CHLNCDRAFT_133375 [Chlorella variabilis]|uniref:Anaphase-promoting complex subunit 4 WD40 domain-containing protein n=1 Tax=Chlorella variabilis TaxID=554065 RepID=E1Z2Z1_CHLVA|nr:hypothetical protein CHLNCDRAFT_133375 [Chlorella variabilis]EFN60077.1 hypothetical protein CHLNCDRAFT_133375 [Chlorella variabilis]|eukprot:XP_005852179.1 hypothetical protein CHLNCDRAFT_133375 [Chlorella variabilis]